MSGVIPWEEPLPEPITVSKDVKVSKAELQHILQTMLFYNRTNGWIGVGGDNKMHFYDGPLDDGSTAYITKQDILTSIETYDDIQQ